MTDDQIIEKVRDQRHIYGAPVWNAADLRALVAAVRAAEREDCAIVAALELADCLASFGMTLLPPDAGAVPVDFFGLPTFFRGIEHGLQIEFDLEGVKQAASYVRRRCANSWPRRSAGVQRATGRDGGASSLQSR